MKPTLIVSSVLVSSLIVTAARAAPEDPSMPVTKAPGVKVPAPPTVYADGPATTDPIAVKAWLGDRAGRSVRLPVAIMLGPDREIQWATLAGMIGKRGTPEGPALTLDDGRLGIGLATHLRRACPAVPGLCVVWLEGIWQAPALVPAPSTAADATRLSLTRVGDTVKRGEVPRVGAAQPRENEKTSAGPAKAR